MGGGAGAGSRPGLGSLCLLLAEVDEAVDEAVLGVEVGEVVKDWQAVGDRGSNLGEGGDGGRLRGRRRCLLVAVCVAPEHKVLLLVVTGAQGRQGGELGCKGRVDGADGQVARIAEVKALLRSSIGRGAGGEGWARN